MTKDELQEQVNSVPYWWHCIELPHGITTPGIKSLEVINEQLEQIRLPSLEGKTVLDIGAWDGAFSFACERRGARRVVALDDFVWQPDHWSGGRKGFDVAHRALNSRVEPVFASFLEADYDALGIKSDIVLWLGGLYHQRDLIEALRRIVAATRELAVIETEAGVFPGCSGLPVCQYLERTEKTGPESDWWVPSIEAVLAMCRDAGFKKTEVVVGPPSLKPTTMQRLRRAGGDALRTLGIKKPVPPTVFNYRAIIHAWV